MGILSRKATCITHGQDSSYFLGWEAYEKNPYHEVKNPNGIIQMGLAENQLSFNLIESWLAKNPEAANFEREGQSIFRELALFQDYHGLPSFKNAMADFMSENRGNRVSFDPKKLVPPRAFLLPTPYYPGFDRDLKWRTGVEIVPIQCTSANGFRITKSALEEAYKQAQMLNLKVKGVLITNPSNPLGTTTTRTELNRLLDFVSRKNIHLISDEIYSGTVFASPGFISVMEVLKEKKLENTDVSKRVHIVYSLSKDLGLPGFRVGVIYSNDDIVVAAATKMSSFGLISSQTQYLLSALLSDKNFTKNYLKENQIRLKNRHDKLVSGLEAVGIECLKSNAGLFCWVKINISPGSSCHCNEPGWFRVCFANMSEETLKVALIRLKMFVDGPSSTTRSQSEHQRLKPLRKMKVSNWVLRLSFQDREPEER
ncbi:hypothetical protein Bca52824_037854 [Brassica carinata]|uniref:Aminotransferase class I/classII large domain-containing protein n=1 Tax=Brassica carinata TaxID=52824 RepID=A0A8X7RN56_BRACI|nr:hypothetical protein Bca52824_037854 [Brassica carinata]